MDRPVFKTRMKVKCLKWLSLYTCPIRTRLKHVKKKTINLLNWSVKFNKSLLCKKFSEIDFIIFFSLFLRLKKSKRLNKNSLCNYDYVFLKIGGGIGVGGTLWALSKTNYSYLTGTSAGVYMLMISVVLLLLTGVVGFVGVLRHNKPVMGSVSHFLILPVFKSLSNINQN